MKNGEARKKSVMIGRYFGKYKVISLLGEGGIGTVYLAEDAEKKEVALKLVRENFFGYSKDSQAQSRFCREIRLALELDHPHIIRTYDGGAIDGRLYLVTELMSGSLVDLLDIASLPEEDSVRIVGQLLEGLVEIEKKGLIHRDIKPANILFDDQRNFKLADFGLLRSIAEDRTFLTETDDIRGTPHYISPEQIQVELGHCLDIRCDLYALGIVFYECLMGSPPFSGRTVWQTLNQHTASPVPPMENTSPPIENFIQQMLSKRREDRPKDAATALKMLRALEQNLDSFSIAKTIVSSKRQEPSRDFLAKDKKELHPIYSNSNERLPRAKLTISGSPQELFVYGGNKLQLGRNAMDHDKQDICLRLRPKTGNEKAIQQISGKHLNFEIQEKLITVVDLESRYGTTLDSQSMPPLTPFSLEGTHCLVVAQVLVLVVTTVDGDSVEVRGSSKTSKSPGFFIERPQNGEEHSYALIAGEMKFTIKKDRIHFSLTGELSIFFAGGDLWIAGGSIPVGYCKPLEGGLVVRLKNKDIMIQKMIPQDQK